MEENEYQRMGAAEESSWWFRARRRILSEVIGRIALPEKCKIADLGCGTGGNLSMLGSHGQVVGVEASLTAVELAQKRNVGTVVPGSATDTHLLDESLDLVTMFDVLEHIEDDDSAVTEVRRILKPEGHFLFTVPAFMFLWSGHDEALHHHRRYRRPQLRSLLVDGGFEVRWLSYYNVSLFPPVAAVRLFRRMLPKGESKADGVSVPPKPINAFLEGLFAFERHAVGKVRFPFGVSLMGLAVKPV